MIMIKRQWIALAALFGLIGSNGVVMADVRVQDIARLKGQRPNKLAGWGLVVGLDGTGDGAKSPSTLRALMELHKVYHAPVADLSELKANNNVAIVSIEVTIPEFGAREGQQVDVHVSAVGPAKSIRGGRLLTTPLQDSTLSLPDILALASGRVDVDGRNPKAGVIRGGATLEEDFFYSFLDGNSITLVLDDSKTGFTWAHMAARAINYELTNAAMANAAGTRASAAVAAAENAVVLDARNIRIEIPANELPRPAGFISRVLQTRVLAPEQAARVYINRTTNDVSFTGTVTIAPTVIQLPGLGAVSVGGGGAGGAGGASAAGQSVVGLSTEKNPQAEFQELLATLGRLQLPPEHVVRVVEHLHRTGTLNAQLVYVE